MFAETIWSQNVQNLGKLSLNELNIKLIVADWYRFLSVYYFFFLAKHCIEFSRHNLIYS